MLYVVATPIGNLGDMSSRAIEVLNSVDFIAAEDTRHSRKLCQHFAITTPMITYQQHNEAVQTVRIIDKLERGKQIALISDAGTPLISDPGFRLLQMVRQNGLQVATVPGPCAAIAAISAAGIDSTRFVFEGFLPSKSSLRITQLMQLRQQKRTLIIYEAPHRIRHTLTDMARIFGIDRQATVARELTKQHESWHQGSLQQLCDLFQENPQFCRGELVIIVEGAKPQPQERIPTTQIIDILAKELPPGEAAALAAKITGLNKKAIYRQITALDKPL